jgi:hypothetical protein
VNNEFHFAISFPSGQGWVPPETKTALSGGLMRPQQLLLMAGKRTGERISIQIVDAGDGVSLDNLEYREGFRNGTMKSFPPTMRLASENQAMFAGVPSYEMLIGGTIRNLPMNIRIVAIVANRYQYNVSGYAGDAASLTDGDLARVLATFRFTERPRLPSAGLTPRNAGEVAGRLAGVAAMIVLLALVGRLLFKRRKKA